jgi:hypothetical protein
MTVAIGMTLWFLASIPIGMVVGKALRDNRKHYNITPAKYSVDVKFDNLDNIDWKLVEKELYYKSDDE